ncbi:MAG: SPASM domain-containing protein, partial [Desulfobacterales bacterium]
VLVDPVPAKTEQLLLSPKQRRTVLKSFKQLKKTINYFDDYSDRQTGNIVRVVNYLELLRKLSQPDAEKGSYDNKAVDQVPCYAGWIFTRIMADGKVVPCCKGHRLAMGNLNEQRFKIIWHAANYARFRSNGLKLKKSAPYYSVMGNDLNNSTGCYNCDNLMQNIVVHRKILSQSNILKWVKFELFQWLNR